MNDRVVVVTGGGNGIGAAIALELGRQGAFVVTLDPMVTLDGSEGATSAEPTTAERIVAAGGQARAANISVTDGDAVAALFDGLRDEFRTLDGVINVAGISRPTGFAKGTEADWRSVLDVHLNGFRNVLEAALPIMSDARHGRILGVTSGSGWRAADAGAYSCAKRAVASLTWQLGWQAPPGVVINAISPIAVTRMVTAALGAGAGAQAGGAASKATGGLNLGSMPQPEELGPLAAYLVSDDPFWLSGEVVFAGGSEVATVEQPRLMEVVRTADVASLPHVLETVAGRAFAAAEEKQASGGGSNPRFAGVFDESTVPEAGNVSTCLIVTDKPSVGEAVSAALEARGVKCTVGSALDSDTDAVVLALSGADESTAATDWERTLQEHETIVDDIYTDAMWARRVADAGRPMRIVTLTDAMVSAGRSRGQAAAQLSRSSRKSTDDRVAAFAVAVEAKGAERTAGELAAYLLCSPDAVALAGAELVVGDGWVGIRSHPRPSAGLTFGGPEIPSWFDGALKAMVR